MILKEIKRILLHIRFSIQFYVIFGFLFALIVTNTHFSSKVVFAFISWFLLWTGITVFNSYYDKDKGPVAGLKKPPKISEWMFYSSLGMKLIGLIMAFFINIIFLIFYISGIILSILYSHSHFRLKSYGWIALLFNFIIGFSTFIVASSLNQLIISIPIILGSIASGLFAASIYIMMQIHQVKEDKNRGDKSISLMYGKKRALRLSLILNSLAGIFTIVIFYMIGLDYWLIFFSILYFVAVIASIFWWSKTKKVDDFKIMIKITNYSNYTANLFLFGIYLYFNL